MEDKDSEDDLDLKPFSLNLNKTYDFFKSNLQPGKLYELALFIYMLINNTSRVFDIGREIKFGDKFDDLVGKECENNYYHYTFLQIKLIDDSNNSENFIDSKVLLGKRKISLKEDDFKLQKYFLSYLRIKDQLNARHDKSRIKKIIIFTNAQLNYKELSRNFGKINSKKTSDNDIIPNTNNIFSRNRNVSYEITKVKDNFFREIKTNIVSDLVNLAEKLAIYATISKTETMTLDIDYFSYYHMSLIDENVMQVTTKPQGKKTIKQGRFTQNFIDNQNLSHRAQNLRNKLTEISTKKGITAQEVQKSMNTAEWTVSDDFDIRKTNEKIFLPNYEIIDKDVSDFFGVLELRVKQLGIKDILSMIMNIEIKRIFLEYYETDPKLVEFLIYDFIQNWNSKNSMPETWILHDERSKFIEKLKIKISKPKAIHKTQEHVKLLEEISNKYDLYYDDSCLFKKSHLKDLFVIVKTSNITLTSIKLIQSLNKIKQHDIIFIHLDNLAHQKEIIKLIDVFCGDKFSLFIISYNNVVDKNICNEIFTKLLKITKENGKKNIIFITSIKEDYLVKKFAHLNNYKEYDDKLLGIKYLQNSLKILEKTIIVQNQSLRLSDFMDEIEIDHNLINGKVIEDLINNNEIRIGSMPLSISNLESAYSDFVEDIGVDTVANELLSEDTSGIYIINGIFESNQETNFLKFLKAGISDNEKKLDIDNIKHHIEILKQNNVTKSVRKKIQISDFVLNKEHFKNICQNNPEKQIYWLAINNNGSLSKLRLEQIYNPDFYITGKRFNNEVVIDKNIKTLLTSETLSESFVISLKNKFEFENWLELTGNEQEQEKFKVNRVNNKIRYIICEDITKPSLQDIREHNPSQTIHFAKFDHNHLIWCNTYGSLENLSKFRKKDYCNTKTLLEEDTLINEIRDKKEVIIVGDPGIGKSTTLVKLCNTKYISKYGTKTSIVQTHWLIKVNLKDHLQVIKNINTSTNDKEAVHKEIVNFLSQVDKSLNNDFAKKLINLALKKKNFKKPILIIFDGFDEVIDSADRHKILFLLQDIKEKTTAKIWISTRLHFEYALESAISSFTIRIEKMNNDQIHEFIIKYLRNNLSQFFNRDDLKNVFDTNNNNVTETKIHEYAYAFTDSIQKIFQGDISKFIGTPLQLYLMLGESARYFKEWIKSGNGASPDFSYLGTNICEIYDKFILRKYNIYFKKTNIEGKLRQERDQVNFDGYHRNFAKFLMFKSTLKKDLEYFKDMLLLAGIVRSYENDIEFIHPTFREYFAAREIICWIRKWKDESNVLAMNFYKQEFLLEQVLLKPEYKMIRTFLNINLLKEKYENVKLKEMYYDRDILIVAAAENHVGIMSFILSNVKKANINSCHYSPYSPFPVSLVVKLPCIHVAVELGNFEMIKYLVENNVDVNLTDKYGASTLHKAIKFCNIDIVMFLVECGADINAKNKNSTSILHYAVNYKNTQAFNFLIKNGANINVSNHNRESVLHCAVKSNNSEMINLLIEKGANIHTKDIFEKSILHSAAECSNLKIVEYLIVNGINVNSINSQGKSVLHSAIESNNIEVVKFLISKHADVNAKDNHKISVLHSAAEYANVEVFEFLIANGACIDAKDKYDRSVLHSAVSSNNYITANNKIVALILNFGVDVNTKDMDKISVLHDAAYTGNFEMVQFLISNGADIYAKDSSDKSIIHKAAESGNLQMVKFLIEKGSHVDETDKYGTSILHIAADRKNFELVKFLIKQGANIDAKKYFDGRTILHCAADNEHFHNVFESRMRSNKPYYNANKIVELLVSRGADVNVKDFRGNSVLDIAAKSNNWDLVKLIIGRNLNFKKNIKWILLCAARSGNLDVIKYLVERFSDINARDNEGRSVLHKATESGNLDVVKYLVMKGVDMSAQDKNGKTILHSKFLTLAIAEFLVEAGADVLAIDLKNKTVLHYAVKSYDLEKVKFLIGKGANVNAKDKNGRSVLYNATYDLPMLKYLIRAGANVNTIDNNQESVIHIAALLGDLDIFNF